MTEKEKMISGGLFDCSDPELMENKKRARKLTQKFNNTSEDEDLLRKEILRELLGKCGEKEPFLALRALVGLKPVNEARLHGVRRCRIYACKVD